MRQSVFLVCLALMLATTFSFKLFNIAQTTSSNDDRVQVTLFYESLCPGCNQYIKGQLTKAASTKVYLLKFRISGRFASSDLFPMETPEEFKTDQTGNSLANTARRNVKET